MNDVFVTNIQRYCIDDGPGIRTTVFLKGCPLRCVWCHNPETHKSSPEMMQRNDKCISCGRCISNCEHNARDLDSQGVKLDRSLCVSCSKCADMCPVGASELCGKAMNVDEILQTVIRDKIFYNQSGGGLTISGGECAMHPEFTINLISKAKELGITSAIETSGYGKSDFYKKAFELNTLFLFDIKVIDAEKHKSLTGVCNDLILENLEMLMSLGAEVVLRLPLIPGVNDSDEDLDNLYYYLNKNIGRYKYCQIMPYHAMGISKSKALNKEYIEISDELTENSCISSRKRWEEHLKEFYNI